MFVFRGRLVCNNHVPRPTSRFCNPIARRQAKQWSPRKWCADLFGRPSTGCMGAGLQTQEKTRTAGSDAALREIEHWLIELGWEAAGRTRQEIFDRMADGLSGSERKDFARRICRSCLCCEIYNDPITTSFYNELRTVAASAIGWVIAEEFGRAGGRWHAHLLIRGVRHMRRKTWWKRAFRRFGRSRIGPIHG